MYDIFFNNKHSFNDLGLTRINSAEHKAPTKNKIYETIPFLNGSYDFSDIYGSANYTARELNYSFFVEVEDENLMNYRKIEIENWLLGTNQKTKLFDEDLKGYYYLAECIDIDFDNYFTFGLINVKFTAYPFKIAENYEGNNIWDDFNFENDILQDTKFTVNGTKKIEIYNPSIIEIEPIVLVSSNFEIKTNEATYVARTGENKDYRLKLKRGANKFTVKGNGTIEFLFRKEVL